MCSFSYSLADWSGFLVLWEILCWPHERVLRSKFPHFKDRLNFLLGKRRKTFFSSADTTKHNKTTLLGNLYIGTYRLLNRNFQTLIDFEICFSFVIHNCIWVTTNFSPQFCQGKVTCQKHHQQKGGQWEENWKVICNGTKRAQIHFDPDIRFLSFLPQKLLDFLM